MTEFVGSNLNFGDLILKEEFDYDGKTWRSFLVVPQEHLQDLFHTPQTISPDKAYKLNQPFWNQISERTRDFYRNYLRTQSISPIGPTRRQWFQWKDFARLEAAYRGFNTHTNEPLRLSVVARDPAM